MGHLQLFMAVSGYFCYIYECGGRTLDSGILNNKQMLLKAFKDMTLLDPSTGKKAAASGTQTTEAQAQSRTDTPENKAVMVMLSMEAKQRVAENGQKKQRKSNAKKKQKKKQKSTED